MGWKDAFPQEGRYFETDNGILYNALCLDILPQIHQKVDLVLTDPPYGIGSDERNGIDYKDNFYDVDTTSKELYNILKDDSRAFVFTAQKTFFDVISGFVNSGGFKLHQTLIWHKTNLTGSSRKRMYDFTSSYEQVLNFHKGNPKKFSAIGNNTDILEYPQPQSNYVRDKRYHIHQKPYRLIEKIIDLTSSNGDIILDAFAGSGTTAYAAEKFERRWIAIEKQEQYCEIAKQRINEWNKTKPLFGFGGVANSEKAMASTCAVGAAGRCG